MKYIAHYYIYVVGFYVIVLTMCSHGHIFVDGVGVWCMDDVVGGLCGCCECFLLYIYFPTMKVAHGTNTTSTTLVLLL